MKPWFICFFEPVIEVHYPYSAQSTLGATRFARVPHTIVELGYRCRMFATFCQHMPGVAGLPFGFGKADTGNVFHGIYTLSPVGWPPSSGVGSIISPHLLSQKCTSPVSILHMLGGPSRLPGPGRHTYKNFDSTAIKHSPWLWCARGGLLLAIWPDLSR